MNDEQPVRTPLREVGIDLDPPHAKPLTVGHRIQRVWALLFGKHNDELRPVYVTRNGMLGGAAVPLTEMIKVSSGLLANNIPLAFGEYVDVAYVAGWSYKMSVPQILGGIDEDDFPWLGFMRTFGGFVTVGEEEIFPFAGELYAHVNKIKFLGIHAGATSGTYQAYRFRE